MIGYRPWPIMKYCWLYVTPFVCMVSEILGFKPCSWAAFQYLFGTGTCWEHSEAWMNFICLSVGCKTPNVFMFFRVPSSSQWWDTSLSSSTKPISTQPGLTRWVGSLDCSVFSWFHCGSSLKCLRWKGQYGRYVYPTRSVGMPSGTSGWNSTTSAWACSKKSPRNGAPSSCTD